ncbi:hypothetical protein HDU67_009970, partial [Dinochytrium kinnereticum]
IREAKSSVTTGSKGAVIVVPEFLERCLKEGKICEDPRFITWSGGVGPGAGLRARLGVGGGGEVLRRSRSGMVKGGEVDDEETDVDEGEVKLPGGSLEGRWEMEGRGGEVRERVESRFFREGERRRFGAPRRAFTEVVERLGGGEKTGVEMRGSRRLQSPEEEGEEGEGEKKFSVDDLPDHLESYMAGVRVFFDPAMDSKTFSVLHRYLIAAGG